MEHLFQLLSKALSLWSRLWCIYKSFQEGLSDILFFHLYSLQAIPYCIGQAGRAALLTGLVGKNQVQFSLNQDRWGSFWSLFPDAAAQIIRDAATEQQQGPDPNLMKVTRPRRFSATECVRCTLQNERSSADKFRHSYVVEESGGALMPTQLLWFVGQV